MKKETVAILFGGCSSEYHVSLESAAGVISHLDRTRFQPVLIGITQQGDWYHFTGAPERIAADRWFGADCTPAALSPSRSSHTLLVFHGQTTEQIPIDTVFPVLHGKNGEDGAIQGLCQLAGIPVAGCGVLSSALCMDKMRAHALAAQAGIHVPASFELTAGDSPGRIQNLARQLGYPLFVKPVRAGSSYGIAKVSKPEELSGATTEAFRYDSRVLLEEAISGFEVGCAILGNRELITGELDEVELTQGFFDYTEKYSFLTSQIHVPARISPEKAAELKQTAMKIYHLMGCACFARVDFFLTPDGKIVFNEVNTIPGFTPHSRFPTMMAAAGWRFPDVITRIIELAGEPE